MQSTSRCPECKGSVHPFAATCSSCGADLDAHRRRRNAAPQRQRRLPQVSVPSFGDETINLVVLGLIMLVLALYSPEFSGPFELFGALFAAFIAWHAHQNGLVIRRNVALACVALAVFNLAAPGVIQPHLP